MNLVYLIITVRNTKNKQTNSFILFSEILNLLIFSFRIFSQIHSTSRNENKEKRKEEKEEKINININLRRLFFQPLLSKENIFIKICQLKKSYLN